MKRRFFIVDVFTADKYAGNQLAVVADSGGLTATEMQRIAREFNFSETTFLLADRPRGGGYEVRIFTPREELPFAGHPTLGTAYVLQKEILHAVVPEIILNLKVGAISVQMDLSGGEPEMQWMTQRPPSFGRAELDLAEAAALFGLGAADLDDRWPLEEVSTGVAALIAPLKTLDSLRRCRLDRGRYFEFVARSDAKLMLAFCPETYRPENHLCARMFAPAYGVEEDPATGSANGALSGYLVKHRYFGRPRIDLRVEQGMEIDRPSLLFLRAEETASGIAVQVGGQCRIVADGILR